MREGTEDQQRMMNAQGAAYGIEHTLSWILALTAMILAVLGTLTGLGVVDLRDAQVATDADLEEGQTLLSQHFWDAAMLLFSAMTAGVLAWCLHTNDHHRGPNRTMAESSRADRGMWTMEHMLAYLVGLGSVIYVVLGLLTGFNAFSGDHDQGDGLIWIWFGLAASTVTAALHMVRHHQTEIAEDYIIAVIEERVAGRTPMPGSTRPGVEPR